MLNDIRRWGLGTAWFNLRWNLAWRIAKFLIRRPIRLSWHEGDDV